MPTMMLAVKLSEPEVLCRGRELAAAVARRAALDEERKGALDDFRRRAADEDADIDRLGRAVRTATEEREVEMRDIPDYRRGVIETLRIDTGDIVGTRAMRPEERQMPLAAVRAIDGKSAAAGDGADDDGA